MSSEGPNTPYHPVFHSQLNSSVHNTLKKDPSSRHNVSSASAGPPKTRLVKSKPSGAADPDRPYEQQATQPAYSSPISGTNRLRKVPATTSSHINAILSRPTGNSSVASPGESHQPCISLSSPINTEKSVPFVNIRAPSPSSTGPRWQFLGISASRLSADGITRLWHDFSGFPLPSQ
jgi:hypothetical protein